MQKQMDFSSRGDVKDWIYDKTKIVLPSTEYGIIMTFFRKGSPKEVKIKSTPRDGGPTEGLYIREKEYQVNAHFKIRWADYDEDTIEGIQQANDPQVNSFRFEFYRMNSSNKITEADERDLTQAIKDACRTHVRKNLRTYKVGALLSIYAQKEYKKTRKKESVESTLERLERYRSEYKNLHESSVRAKRAVTTLA